MQGSDVRLNEGGFIDQIAEQLAIGDEGGRISPLLCCDRLELIGLPVDHLDRLSLLVHPLHIAGQLATTAAERRTSRPADRFSRMTGSRTEECGRSSQRRAWRRCRAPLHWRTAQSADVCILPDRYRAPAPTSAWLRGSCSPAGSLRRAGLGRPHVPAGSRSSTWPGGWRSAAAASSARTAPRPGPPGHRRLQTAAGRPRNRPPAPTG